eukprot:Skav219532  [mRNA]  locus=scaffold30:616199:626974:- [translate_table: standard]
MGLSTTGPHRYGFRGYTRIPIDEVALSDPLSKSPLLEAPICDAVAGGARVVPRKEGPQVVRVSGRPESAGRFLKQLCICAIKLKEVSFTPDVLLGPGKFTGPRNMRPGSSSMGDLAMRNGRPPNVWRTWAGAGPTRSAEVVFVSGMETCQKSDAHGGGDEWLEVLNW